MCRLMFIDGHIFKDVIEALIWESFNLGNNDGYGFVNSKKFYKTLDFSKFYSKLLNNVEPKTLIHLRMASMGAIKKENAHPFEHLGFYWAHNGSAEVFEEAKNLKKSDYLDWMDDTKPYGIYSTSKSYYFSYNPIVDTKTDTERFVQKIKKIDKKHLKKLTDKHLSGIIYAYNPTTQQLIVLATRQHYLAEVKKDNKTMYILSSQKDILQSINSATREYTTTKRVYLFNIKITKDIPIVQKKYDIKIYTLPKQVEIYQL